MPGCHRYACLAAVAGVGDGRAAAARFGLRDPCTRHRRMAGRALQRRLGRACERSTVASRAGAGASSSHWPNATYCTTVLSPHHSVCQSACARKQPNRARDGELQALAHRWASCSWCRRCSAPAARAVTQTAEPAAVAETLAQTPRCEGWDRRALIKKPFIVAPATVTVVLAPAGRAAGEQRGCPHAWAREEHRIACTARRDGSGATRK